MAATLAFLAVLALEASSASPEQAQADSSTGTASRPLDYNEKLGLPLFAGAIASVALPPVIYKTPPACRWCDANLNVVDRFVQKKVKWDEPCNASKLSYVSLAAAGAVALGPMSHEDDGNDWLVNSGAVADSVAATIILTQVVKYTVRRSRPQSDSCHPGRTQEPDRNLSFFSGHTALAFALVSSAHETARLRGRETNDWMWVGTGAAAVTAYLRVAGGRHHLFDVLTGAGVGYVMGRWIPRHVARPVEPQPPAPGQAFRPSVPPAVFAYSRPVGADGGSLLQVGKGPGRSIQIALSF